jgi:hypothetical protein
LNPTSLIRPKPNHHHHRNSNNNNDKSSSSTASSSILNPFISLDIIHSTNQKVFNHLMVGGLQIIHKEFSHHLNIAAAASSPPTDDDNAASSSSLPFHGVALVKNPAWRKIEPMALSFFKVRLVGWLVGRLVGSVGYVGWLVGWLVVCLVGRLVGFSSFVFIVTGCSDETTISEC